MRYVVRNLSSSDLTFFSSHYTGKGAKQKAINLDAVPFLSLYPALKGVVQTKIPVTMAIQGPDHSLPVAVTDQKVTKSQKNWRLNGSIVQDPSKRFAPLKIGDLAIIGFSGDATPEHVSLILLSKTDPTTKGVFDYLETKTSAARTMHVMAPDEIEVMSNLPGLTAAVAGFLAPLDEDTFVAAASGSPEAQKRIVAVRGRCRVSREELDRSRARADEVGREGESLIETYLASLKSNGVIKDYVWESDLNAIHPWDFTIIASDDRRNRVEVKSTTNKHETPFHVSRAEFNEIHTAQDVTELWRVSRLHGGKGTLRISQDILGLSKAVHESHEVFMASVGGVRSDGWTVSPQAIAWEDEIQLS